MERGLIVRDYRSALQTATAPLHGEIDALFGAFDLGRRDGLTRFLMAQAIGMAACQPHTQRFGQAKLGCSPPDYGEVLKADLAALGVHGEQLPRLSLPGNFESDWFENDWAGAGIFYVVAGSRMGAAVLRKRATALTPGGPAHSVCGYFAVGEGPAMWRLFREWLADSALRNGGLASEGPANAAGGVPSGLAVMIGAATATFQLFAAAAHLATGQTLPPLSSIDAGTRSAA